MGRGLHTILAHRRAPPPSLVRALLRHAGVGSPCSRDPRGSGWGRWGACCAGPAAPPPPRVAVPSGGGGAAPPPPRPVRRRPAIGCLRRAPPGYTRAVGVAGRPRASGAAWSAANGSMRRGGGGEGGGTPPPWFAPRLPQGRPPTGPLRLRRPGRRRSAFGRQRAGRAGSCLGRGARAPRVQRPLRGGRGTAVPSICLRPLLGLSGSGRGGELGGPSRPLTPPLDAEGGMAWRRRPRGPAIGWGVAPCPHPPLPRAGPSCRPSLGPFAPSVVVARSWPAGAAVRVSGQRLAGCGAVGSPSRSLSLPSPPREVARAPSTRRTVGGAWVRGPSSPPHFLGSAIGAVTCTAACVGAGAAAAAGCAGGSASG